MIHYVEIQEREKLATLFKDFDDTVVSSCLQGHMGSAYVDDLNHPTVAQIIVGIFVFYAGDPDADEANELLHNLPDFTLATVKTEEWKKKIEALHKGSFEKIKRYEFYKNPNHLNQDHIKKNLADIPEGYELKPIDLTLAEDPSLHELSEDFISQFNSTKDFLDRGMGFVILHKGKAVCGATSFSIYDDGIEIEVATHPDYRRKGLATITASALILECLSQGLYPSWDAANMESVKLAEKLGYKFKTEYETYVIG
ncbi:GNAT family N-acetyltransferase [Alkalibacillus haloalkaliphilus]|uniref:Zwittermicin A resistance protein ZmaR n=1 Tax=Alkalibacillus haloalkaliphilus TaxID=94136 RepID=A0A511W514_9BACI|nr:GNAT family N-acetyltransferase [Alkalibacillus haloalkaliphilus]GEN45428.1 zwittermicin A resistance protein ZmaR [Alkalibacillus haloalkaliphilus]